MLFQVILHAKDDNDRFTTIPYQFNLIKDTGFFLTQKVFISVSLSVDSYKQEIQFKETKTLIIFTMVLRKMFFLYFILFFLSG